MDWFRAQNAGAAVGHDEHDRVIFIDRPSDSGPRAWPVGVDENGALGVGRAFLIASSIASSITRIAGESPLFVLISCAMARSLVADLERRLIALGGQGRTSLGWLTRTNTGACSAPGVMMTACPVPRRLMRDGWISYS